MSPHGGKRKGAGRKAEGEKRTANLCGVRLKPSRLLAYRDVAMAHAVTLTKLIETVMDVFIAQVQDSDPGDAYDYLVREHDALDIDEVYAEYVERLKRKGKKHV